ncbi:phosphoribosylanthranilate isomerase [Candidatus Mycalebacterium sp.]
MTKVKVCGITNADDAIMAADMGAAVVGFIFYPGSRRHVEPEPAALIASLLPSNVVKAGVFVNQEVDFIGGVMESVGLDLAQIHGDETPQFCSQIPGVYMKAIRVKNRDSLKEIDDYDSNFVLLDTFADRQFGGTGRTFDWDLLRGIDLKGKKLFLSGGLNSGNVAESIGAAKPYAVDVCSGVEKKPGVKDSGKLKQFMEEVKIADNNE